MPRGTLANVRVVLVEPSHPGNVGAAARAMKTMGLRQLVLVSPGCFPSAEATARASGADDVLTAARVVGSLPAAVAECALVVATSARARSLRWPELSPREAAPVLLGAAATAPAAVVFGREASGLTNAEVDRCQYLLRIPCDPTYSSLNLAAAVQVVAYELWVSSQTLGDSGLSAAPREPVAGADMEGLLRHFEQTAVDVGFLDPAAPRRLVRRLWRLLNRAQPDRTELNLLRGFLKAAQIASRRGRADGAGGGA
jgi:TrmH family RNA methyltransferase